jgi:lipopolysaccharide/colanic/teichoic acid biosynthesis glycosyltransferase
MPTVLIFVIDLLLAAAAVELAGWIVRIGFYADATLGLVGTTVAAIAAIATAAIGSYLTGLNSPSLLVQAKQVVARTAFVGFVTALATLVVAYFVWYTPIGRTGVVLVGLLSFALLCAWRLLYGHFLATGPRVRMLVLGTGPIEQRFALRLNTLAHTRYVIAGFVRDGSRPPGSPEPEPLAEAPSSSRSGVVLGVPLPDDVVPPPELGELDAALDLCRREGIGHAIVVGVAGLSPAQVQAMSRLQAHGIRVHTAGAVWMNVALQVPIDMVDARWVLNTFEQLDRPGVLAAKRMLDLAVAGVGLLGFGLMFPLLWLMQRIDDPGPFFYSQDRVGLGGSHFRVHKIRTMRVAKREEQRWAAKDDDRTTRFGRLLRRTRIDELPQFWNVLRGEMSLVGPRPEQPRIVEQLEREIPYFGYRHLVKPGITGWAQIHQGYAASVDESAVKLSYDLYYVGRMSLLLDLDIMLRTAFVMVARIGSR